VLRQIVFKSQDLAFLANGYSFVYLRDYRGNISVLFLFLFIGVSNVVLSFCSSYDVKVVLSK